MALKKKRMRPTVVSTTGFRCAAEGSRGDSLLKGRVWEKGGGRGKVKGGGRWPTSATPGGLLRECVEEFPRKKKERTGSPEEKKRMP